MNSLQKGNIGEEFVNNVAYKSLIKYWCYPSPKDVEGDKKEICDLLILFDTTVIIISVKNYEFKDNYARYFKKTIDKAVKQVYGAERKLFSKQRDVYFQHPNKKLEKFPKDNIKDIFRIIINLGKGVRFYPFNMETKDEKFITIFDKEAFETILKELDTIPDFIDYLKKRESFFFNKKTVILPAQNNDFPDDTANQFFEYTSNNIQGDNKKSIIISGTEQDLLAYYLKNDRNFSEKLQMQDSDLMVLNLEENWKEFISYDKVKNKKQEDKYSYFIDNLIEKEVLTLSTPESEEIAKELLSFDRFHRRVISRNFIDFCNTYQNSKGLSIARRYFDIDGTGIVFVFYTDEIKQQESVLNFLLNLVIQSFCVYSKYQSRKMILIATMAEFKQFKFILDKDVKPFTEGVEQQIRTYVKSLGWFTNQEYGYYNEKEYPETSQEKS